MNNQRLISLDAFRGFTIAAMILVNNPGSWEHIYAPLRHKEWNGLTPTDLIFPFFIFIVGVSIVLSYSRRIASGNSHKKMVGKILSRFFKIFITGILLNLISMLMAGSSELRIAGVLQRIAIVFLICSLMYILTSWRIQILAAVFLLTAYWLVMAFVPTPGYGKVMLEPGINMAAWVDSKLLPGKMWEGTWDPEGILSTIPAVASGILGMMAGKIITSEKNNQHLKVIWLFSAGFLTAILGYAWGWVFPLNKNLWTSSYVLFTGGLASMVLATCLFFIDVLGNKKYSKFCIIFGANAITLYVLSDLLAWFFYSMKLGGESINMHFMSFIKANNLPPEFGSFFFAIIYVLVCYIPACWLYRKKIFIKI